ncbi:hypothetical protein B9Z19DRAFT_1122196 [Tuber borchii]|uniref:Uncharacterized protein n=1 Tax=Tuber borchii TaxID=42251 RepID=A0A2T7A119_TUBBO|nr:hypothetical protein B9Z19DRAFT_1122196 [Tuber borchii]
MTRSFTSPIEIFSVIVKEVQFTYNAPGRDSMAKNRLLVDQGTFLPPFATHNSWQKHSNAQFLAASAKLYGYRISPNVNSIQATEVAAKRECLQVLEHIPSLRLPPPAGSNSKRKLNAKRLKKALMHERDFASVSADKGIRTTHKAKTRFRRAIKQALVTPHGTTGAFIFN